MASKRQKASRTNYFKREQAGRIDGPGVFVTCVRGKERQSVSELYDVFESIAADLWPEATAEVALALDEPHPQEDEEEGGNVEDEIMRELQTLKRPRKEKRFSSVHTETACCTPFPPPLLVAAPLNPKKVLFISCRPPVNPVQLVTAYLEEVERTGRARTRYVNRLLPAEQVCVANLPEVLAMARRVLPGTFGQGPGLRYKLEISIINHSKLTKAALIPPLAELVPADRGHTVDLKHPEAVILVQVFKTWCGVGVVRGWERWRRWNVMLLAEQGPGPGEPHAPGDGGGGREELLQELAQAPEEPGEPQALEEGT
ncbi:hypothetical protein CALCODRAFT_483002 [Calocera cornea HHB12733]|uniref:THUMP domain-containing protein n=1 Tax=Calocera cornea HHB12733 TaxID=1353952 RepID=A0A165G703_9BASI|nr:hypothetical protein CALCODRAFT_483002 [Calocera cornea HHB12733]